MLNFTKRRFLATVGVAAFALCCTGAQAQEALANINKSKTIRIGIPTDYPPYGSAGLDMKPQGLDIDVANLVAQKLGVKAELVPVVSANRIPYLQTKKVDVVISTLGKNEERAKVIDFSAAYAPFFQGVFARKELTIKSFDDLAGKTVAVTRGAMEDEMLVKMAPSTAIIKRFEDQAATTAAFASGQTQAIGTSVSNIGVLAERQPQLGAEYKLLLRVSPCFMGLAKGEDALRNRLNEIILAAKADGTLNELSKKWLKREAGELPL